MNIHQTSSVTTSSGFTALVLSQMRVAFFRSRLITNEIATIGAALRGGHISPETALLHLHEAGLDWVTELSS